MEATGVTLKSVDEWLAGIGPRPEKAMRVAINAVIPVAEVREAPASYAAPSPPAVPWLDTEWQETHSFTAIVECLRRLERRYPLGSKSPQKWKTSVAWEAVLAGRDVIFKLADWTEGDWSMVFHEKLDHWKRPRPGRRSEAETLRERLQTQFGFGEDGK